MLRRSIRYAGGRAPPPGRVAFPKHMVAFFHKPTLFFFPSIFISSSRSRQLRIAALIAFYYYVYTTYNTHVCHTRATKSKKGKKKKKMFFKQKTAQTFSNHRHRKSSLPLVWFGSVQKKIIYTSYIYNTEYMGKRKNMKKIKNKT